MKSRLSPLVLIAAVFTGLTVLTGGCASKTSRKDGITRPAPQSAGVVDEALRRQKVDARASQLLKSGKAGSYSEAQRAASAEFPAPPDPSSATWSAEYAQWEKEKSEREKFEADFAKSIRSR